MSLLRLQILDTGYTEHWESVTLKGAPRKKISFPATVAVIEHPKYGVVLFDTGYSPKFYEQTKYFPEKFYAMVTPVFVTPELTAIHQLKQMGIHSRDVRAVILSHFHADHISGVSDFPEATFVYRRSAYDDIKNKNRVGQVKAGFLKGLLPSDFSQRSRGLVDTDFSPMTFNLTGYDRAHDYFGDGSLLIIDLPGHTVGQIGLYAETDKGKILLVADACWSHKAVTQNKLPARIAGFVFSDWQQYSETLKKLNSIYKTLPEIKIFPCHCQEAMNDYRHEELVSAIKGKTNQTQENHSIEKQPLSDDISIMREPEL